MMKVLLQDQVKSSGQRTKEKGADWLLKRTPLFSAKPRAFHFIAALFGREGIFDVSVD